MRRRSLEMVRRWIRALACGAKARRSIAVRAGLGVGLTLGAGAGLGDLSAGMLASQGCFAVLYGTQAPYRRRAFLVAVVGACMASSAGLGTLVAGSIAWTVVVGGIFATFMSLLVIALRLGPPREFFPLMVFLLVAHMPVDASALLERMGFVLAGAGVAWLLAMSPMLTSSPRPEQVAAEGALMRIADLLDAIGTEEAVDARHHAIVAVRAGVIAADDAGGAAGDLAVERMARIERLLEAVMALEVEAAVPLDPRWGQLVRAVATGKDPASVQAEIADLTELPSVRRLQVALSELARGTPDPAQQRREVASTQHVFSRWPAPSEWWVLRQPHPRIAARMGLVVAATLGVGYLLELDHPAWVGISAVAVLQGAHARVIGRRALNRAIGTLAGVLLANAVLELSLSTWGLVAVIAGLQCIVELFVTTSYALAVVVITPLVLLLSEFGTAVDAHPLVGVRLVDTLVGCAVAALVVLVTSPWTPIGRLGTAQAAVMAAIGSVFDAAFGASHASPELVDARRRLQSALIDLRIAAKEAVGDAVWSDPAADARWPITALLERLAHVALTFPTELIANGARRDVDREALRASLDAMAALIAEGRAPYEAPECPPPPELGSLPRTNRALAELRATLCAG